MAPGAGATGKERPTERELLDEVARHHDGIDALTLTTTFTEMGYHPYSVQRTIQRAMDKGDLEVGPKLRLYASHEAA